MKKRAGLISCVLITVMFTGCFLGSKYSLSEVEQRIQQLEDKSPELYQLIGAENGASYYTDYGSVEIFIFKNASGSNSASEAYNDTRVRGNTLFIFFDTSSADIQKVMADFDNG